MAKIHMILQGKGGVGKSFISSTLAQHRIAKGKNPLCIDTDPVNATFYGFKKLNVKQINVMNNDEIDPRKFDDLIELIANTETDVIIDNGASTFVPMSHYLISNHIPSLLLDMGHELVVHTVITGSQALLDTLNGFVHLVKQFPKEALFVVWLNPYWGEITMNGKQFEEMKAYLDNKARVSAIIRIPHYKPETFGKDLSEILQSKFTFDEALKNSTLPVMVRQRLTIIRRQLFTNLENVAAVFVMNNDRLDALIKRIASEHGIVLTKDDPVLMMHTLNEVLLEQNEKAQAELLSKYEAILQESFNQWHSYASKKANALINVQQNHFSKNHDQVSDQCMQLIGEKIRIAINHEIRELTRISRQAAIINLLAAVLVLVSTVIVSFTLL